MSIASSLAVIAIFVSSGSAILDEGVDSKTLVSGRITFEGKKPSFEALKLTPKQTKGCASHGAMDLGDRSLLVGKKGGLANVVITIKVDGMKGVAPKEPVVLDNSGCRFEPHVIVLPIGAGLLITNSDETTHNVHTYSRRSSSVNKTISGGTETLLKIKRSEVFSVKCDMHTWMSAWVFATDAAFVAVSDADGHFELKGIPPGKYKAKLWHETLGKSSEVVTVTEDGTVNVDWKMSKQKRKK